MLAFMWLSPKNIELPLNIIAKLTIARETKTKTNVSNQSGLNPIKGDTSLV